MKKITVLDFVLALFVSVALVNWGTVFWFDFNIVSLISFGMRWLEGTIYTIVSVVGLLWVWSLVVRTFMAVKR